MKTKKLVSLFLAVAMIFAVLTVVVSAADFERYTWGEVEPYSPICGGVGYLGFTNYSRSLTAWTQVSNLSTTSQFFRVQVQCAINYASGNYDFDVTSIEVTIPAATTRASATKAELSMIADSSETIVSFVAEYHIGDYYYNSLWEGYIGEDYYLGINA